MLGLSQGLWDYQGGLGYVLKVANFRFRQLLHPPIWVLSSLSSVHNELHFDSAGFHLIPA